MELFVSTVASTRATAPLSFASFHHRRRAAPSAVAVRHSGGRRRLLQARGWRCASAAVPDPVPSEEPSSASTVVVVTEDKPDPLAEEKSGDVAAVSNGGPLETAAPAPASSETAEEDGGLDDILSKLDIQVTPTYVLYGSGAFIVLLVLSSVVSAIDSIPLVPKVLELIGTGYSIWFTSRYLLFKESRDDLFAKFNDLKERII
ncbi:protein CURVATURE THYLAKOID 1D, chloroplastic-like [Oryza brachyantha]|uniref:protein CURVATURE THYLAKOID 1D, chloroplastic-like n=1 Tax=Oryza brachyantha TaxID=4533 RepID=UPI001AD958B4|nr:protein CURVATURE THYLAKOID 1D, chloroplastic-like [Oryza brachyantha]